MGPCYLVFKALPVVQVIPKLDGKYPSVTLVLRAEPERDGRRERLVAVEWSGKGLDVGKGAEVGDVVNVEAFVSSWVGEVTDGRPPLVRTNIRGWRLGKIAKNLPPSHREPEDLPPF